MGRGQTNRFVAIFLVLAFVGWDRAIGLYTTQAYYPQTTTTQDPMCEGEADILFVLDASGSISENTEYVQELQFAADVSQRFMVGPNKIHFSAIVFSDSVSTVFSFTQHLTNAAVNGALAGLPYFGHRTFTGAALNRARTFAFTSQNNARSGVPKIVIVITDGQSTDSSNTQLEANLLKMSGATVIAVGVGNSVVQSELITIASDPSLVFNVGDFNALSTIRDQVALVACPDPVQPKCIKNCVGREDGNYPACSPLCEHGFYFSCVSEYTYKMPCPLAYYTDHNGRRFLAKMVYDPRTDSCELSYDKCPRNPEDHEVIHVHGGNNITRYLNNPCLTPYDSCYGRPDGNYPMCNPYCRNGFFYSCSNGERYEMPCPLAYYTDYYGNRFTARMVYDTRTDTCELTVPNCPRYPGEVTYHEPHYTDPHTTYAPTTPCNGRADILFILDSSGSVGFSNFQVVLNFAASLTTSFTLGSNAVQFGAIIFSDNIVNLFSLNAHDTQPALSNAIGQAVFRDSTTNTAQALSFARVLGFSIINGARPNVGKVAIVVTDGISNDPTATATQAANLKNTGVTVIAVGVGSNVGAAELQAIATSAAHVFRVSNFMGLSAIQQELVTLTCEEEHTCLSYSCAGRRDGNYAACSPLCAQGYYISCVNEFAYKMPCALAYYTDHHGNRCLARMVYNPYTDSCELSSSYCPRNPEDYKVPVSNYTTTTPDPWNPTCLSYRDSCYGRRDGNYPLCYPHCQRGFFITCSNGEAYEMPCALGWYTYNGVRFTHKMVYNPSTDSCELTVPYCPRDVRPKDPVHTTPTVYYPGDPDPCNGKADILLIKDSSGSIGLNNYATVLAFLADLTSQFSVGPNGFLFSTIVFSSSASIEFGFGAHGSNNAVSQALAQCPYIGGGTNTAAALNLARTSGFSSSNGARANVPKIAIVITDGVSNDESATALAADALHGDGVIVISIGVGSARDSELQAIASTPNNVFSVSAFNTLTQIRDSVVGVACQAQDMASSCVTSSSDCHGRPAGNYQTCDTYRHKAGWYWTCSGGYGHQIQCGVLWCHNAHHGAYTGYGVFSSSSRQCERDATTCPP